MKKILLLLSIAVISLTAYASPQTFKYTHEGHTLTYGISYEETGTCYVYSADVKMSGALVIPSTVSDGTNTYTVTSIEEHAFYECSAITSIIIPDSVTKIGEHAFDNCYKLKSITIGSSVASIGDNAFNFCGSLTKVIFKDGAGELKLGTNYHDKYSTEGLFTNCPIDTLYIGRNLSFDTFMYRTPFYDKATMSSVTFGGTVTNIENNIFCGCTGLRNLTFEDSPEILRMGYYDEKETYKMYSLFKDCPLEHLYLGRDIEYVTPYSDYYPFKDKYELTELTIGKYVTSIKEKAFEGCSKLKSLVLPDAVNSIGYAAFNGCDGLETVILSNSLTYIGERAFYGCSRLKEIALPNSLTEIGNRAFYGCRGLTSVIIPDSVISIQYEAFKDCDRLTSVTMGKSVTNIGRSAFEDCDGLTSVNISDLGVWASIEFDYNANPLRIARHLYLNGEEITEAVIPDSVTSIGMYAFEGCEGLTSVTVPNSVTSIGDYAFSNCTGIKKLIIEDGTETLTLCGSATKRYGTGGLFSFCPIESLYLGRNLYYGSDDSPFGPSLKTITIGDSVTRLNDGIFWNCDGLTSIGIPDAVASIGNNAFNSCNNLTSIAIGSSVAYIGKNAFYGCGALTSVNISDLEAWCNIEFNENGNPLRHAHHLILNGEEITGLEIPASVTSINDYAFEGCNGLTSVAVPNSVTSIGDNAFSNCQKLTAVRIEDGVTPLSLSNGITDSNERLCPFYGSPVDTLYLGRNLTYAASQNYNDTPFYGMDRLSAVTIGNSVTSIRDDAFRGLHGITTLTLGNSVASIGKYAFYDCPAIADIVSLNPDAPEMESGVFDNSVVSSAVLRIPQGSLESYRKASVWKGFLNITDDILCLKALPAVRYGDEEIDLTDYAPEGMELTYETFDTDVIRIDGSRMQIVGAGTATVDATLSGSSSGMEVMALTRMVAVGQADLTVTVANITIEEGQQLPEFKYLVKGLKYDDTVDDIDSLPAAVCDVDENTPEGVYEVEFTGGSDRNYRIITQPAYVTVIARSGVDDVTVDPSDADVEIYNLEGIRVFQGPRNDARLVRGIYIIRQGNISTKIYIY